MKAMFELLRTKQNQVPSKEIQVHVNKPLANPKAKKAVQDALDRARRRGSSTR